MLAYCLLIMVAFWSSVSPARALQGVGALADQLATGTLIQITGKTAPWAEVVVVDKIDDRVVAVAEIEPTGEFNFRFRLRGEPVGQLQILANDDFGVTTRVELVEALGQEILMPPTIVNDLDDLSTTASALRGMSYPGAEIELVLSREGGETTSFQLLADDGGYWHFLKDDLTAGKYTGTARSRWSNLTSNLSQEIYFEILAIPVPETVIDLFDEFIKGLPIPDFLKTLLLEQPELIARLLAPLAAIPVIGLWLRDFLALLLRLLYGLLHLFGWRKERRRWGIVYDSISKKPVSRAIVRLYELVDGQWKLAETDVTTAEGEFAFLPRAGRYQIKVAAGGVVFPSVIVKGKGRDGEYLNLYHGESIDISEGDEVAVSIPVDPVGARVKWWFYAKKYLKVTWRIIGWLLLISGLIFALRALIVTVSALNLAVAGFYLGLIIWNLFNGWRSLRRVSVVKDVMTGKGIGNVSVAVYETEFKRLVQRRVSDGGGRVMILLRPGRYVFHITAIDFVWDKTKGYRGEMIEVKGRGTARRPVKVKIYMRLK